MPLCFWGNIMNATAILGNVVWTIAACFVLIWCVGLVKKWTKKEPVGWQILFPLVWGSLSLVITALTDFSKFHLLWMLPLGVIFPLAILGIQLWTQFKSLGTSFKDMAAQMTAALEQQKRFYRTPLEMIDANPEDFSSLDLAWYDETRKEIMDGIGAEFVADLEMTTLNECFPETKTFVRTLAADDGKIVVAIHNIKAYGPDGNLFQETKTVEYETLFSDGSFLQTSNSEGINIDESCDGIRIEKLPPETPWQETLKAHRAALEQLVTCENLTLTSILTKKDIIETQKRFHELMSKAKQAEWDEMELLSVD